MGIKKGTAPNRNFTQVPNDLIRNRSVSDGAFRLICWITSHADGFDISFSGIRSALGYGRDGLRSIIKNAEQNNYLVRVKSRDDITGQFDWDYHIFAHQQDAIAFRESFRESIDGLPTPGATIDGLPTGGSATGGLDHPHKEYKEEQHQSKKNKPENNSPCSPPGDNTRNEQPMVDGLQEEDEFEAKKEVDSIPCSTAEDETSFLVKSSDSEKSQISEGVATRNKNKNAINESLQVFFDAYNAEKPSNFTNHRELSEKHIRSIRKLIAQYKERSLDIFVGALTWCREQKDDWWRNKPLSLDELLSNGKVVSYADKHFDALETDPGYCDRVEGRAVSKDPGRSNGFQIFDEQGKEVTGASARAAAAVANDPLLALFLEQI